MAPGLPLDYSGFDPSSLVVFRKRLLKHGEERYAFDRFLKVARAAGFVPDKIRQLLDSTAMKGAGAAENTYTLLRKGIRRLLRAMGFSLPAVPGAKTAGAHRAGPLKEGPRINRHAQLTGREEGGKEHSASGGWRRDRASANRWCGKQIQPRTRSPIERLRTCNKLFGNIPWTDADCVHNLITQGTPDRVASDTAYRNARKNSDEQHVRIEHDKAPAGVMIGLIGDATQSFKKFSDKEGFHRWLAETVFALTNDRPDAA